MQQQQRRRSAFGAMLFCPRENIYIRKNSKFDTTGRTSTPGTRSVHAKILVTSSTKKNSKARDQFCVVAYLADDVLRRLVHSELRPLSSLGLLGLVTRPRRGRLLSVSSTHD